MAFPAGLTLVSVHCRFDTLPSGGAAGLVRFTGGPLTGATDNSVVPYIDVSASLDASGECTVQLPATNDPGWVPVDRPLDVVVSVGTRTLRGTLLLDYQTTSVELSDLIQWDGAATTGTTYATLAQLGAHEADTTNVHGIADTSALATLNDVEQLLRVVDAGEYVIPRGEVTTESPASAFNLYVTHFRAATTETIQTIRTGIGTGQATGAEHAWIGIMGWDGVNYTPIAASVDDPTRWAAEFATYNTQLYAYNHAGESGFEGWNKVAGVDYAMWVLWIGSGDAPNLFASGGGYQDSLEEPRTNAYIGGQTQPPAAPISGAFFGPDSRRFQGLMKR